MVLNWGYMDLPGGVRQACQTGGPKLSYKNKCSLTPIIISGNYP